ncbi:hypothetical protein [Burkholderia ubonensis]|uniref:hypothetical protein n=1 Tax=Burkholderia ubonensis TaxID=101571 RepID=UPI00075A5268|nr:hypothetical protein [Burkholderia ubonensis]KUZ80157.1 hypothetical protein WI37_08515 [Burkholderia ubonensis]
MAASEVVVAASHVVATVAQAPVNWYGIVASSAAIGAAITAAATLYGQRLTRKHEKAKLAEQRADEQAKLAAQRAPAQLDAALMLEAFARQAVGYFDGCQAQVFEWRNRHAPELRDGGTGAVGKWVPLTLDVSLVKDWSVLPIEIVSQCRELPLLLAESEKWTNEMAKEDWVDTDDAYDLDSQRGILYGLLACELATQIRATIKVPASGLATDSFIRLQREFGKLKRAYVRERGSIELIPDLRTRLQRECPAVPDPFPPAPPTVLPIGGDA